MTYKPSILSTLLIASFFFLSFRTPDKNSIPDLTDGATHTKTNFGLDTGRIVNIDSIQDCLNNYKTMMKNHGFSNPGGKPYSSTLTVTDKLTTGESFSGKDLRAWLDATDDEYTSQGKVLSIRIAFGVYDMKYLNTYEPDPTKRAKSNNRVSVFLIPYDASSGGSIKPHAMAAGVTPAGGSGSGGGAYDFGGLQP
jgi:hypothetical protein